MEPCLLSASEVNGAFGRARETNPYHAFQTLKPDEEIDNGILVYRGDVHMEADRRDKPCIPRLG